MRSWDSWILGFLAAVVLVQASGAGEGGAKHGAKAPRSAPGSVKALVYQDLAAGRTAHRPELARPLPSFLCVSLFLQWPGVLASSEQLAAPGRGPAQGRRFYLGQEQRQHGVLLTWPGPILQTTQHHVALVLSPYSGKIG